VQFGTVVHHLRGEVAQAKARAETNVVTTTRAEIFNSAWITLGPPSPLDFMSQEIGLPNNLAR